MLVMGSRNIRRHQMCGTEHSFVAPDFRLTNSLWQHDARQCRIDLQGAVLMEDIVDRVIVVSHGRYEENDQLAPTSRLILARVRIVVFPEESAVTFIDADGTFQL